MANEYNFYKQNDGDKIWWVDNGGEHIGERLFSFDKHHVFNLFTDYPEKLSAAQKELFDKENEYWARFFSDRQK